MINFTRLELRNFLSFGNITEELDLSVDGSTLILGDNVDSNSKNGAGKSSLLNAISYALYNKPISNISKERLLNRTNAAKNTLMEVRLTFELSGNEYTIYRTRGESYVIQLFENGLDITPDSIAATDRKIVELVGISYDLFVRVIVFSGADQPFLEMPLSTQRTLIEELFKITALSEKAVKLREIIKAVEGEVAIKSALIKAQEQAVEHHQKRINDAEERIMKWETERESTISTIEEDLARIAKVDFKQQRELLESKVPLTAEIAQVKTAKELVMKDIKNLEKKIAQLTNEMQHLNDSKCPYCLQAFADAGKKVDDLQNELDTKAEVLLEQDELRTQAEVHQAELETSLAEISSAIIYTNMNKLLEDQKSVTILQEKLHQLKDGVNPHVEAYEDLLAEEVKDPDYAEIDEYKKELEHNAFLLKLLTDKNSFVRRRIINKTIPFLNTQINYYTTYLGLPHVVKFDSDMSCSVQEFGRELDFGNLSSGEKKRVNLALSLAFRDVLHRLHHKVNLLLIDEIDAGLDSGGVELAFKLIKKKSRDDETGMWIISHRPEAEGRFDREITVRKEQGFSSIVYQE